MTITKTRVTCAECQHVCDVELVTDAPIAVAVASMQSARCPKCGGSKLGLGGEISRGKPPLSSSIETRAAWWIEFGSVGTSSRTIWSAFTGARPPRPSFPLDPDDFSRCRALLDLIPEWRADLTPLTKAFPWYKPFVDQWQEMDRLWDLERHGHAAPRLYAFMQKARKEAEAMLVAEKGK